MDKNYTDFMNKNDRRFERKVNPNLCGAGDKSLWYHCSKCDEKFEHTPHIGQYAECPYCGTEGRELGDVPDRDR